MNVKEGGWRAKDSLSAKEKKKKKKVMPLASE